MSPTPALSGNFDWFTEHVPIKATLTTAAVQRPLVNNHAGHLSDFDKASLRDLTEELERTDWEQILMLPRLD